MQTIKVHGVKRWVLLVALFHTTHGQTHNGVSLFGTRSALQNVRYSNYMFYIVTGLMISVPLMEKLKGYNMCILNLKYLISTIIDYV